MISGTISPSRRDVSIVMMLPLNSPIESISSSVVNPRGIRSLSNSNPEIYSLQLSIIFALTRYS